MFRSRIATAGVLVVVMATAGCRAPAVERQSLQEVLDAAREQAEQHTTADPDDDATPGEVDQDDQYQVSGEEPRPEGPAASPEPTSRATASPAPSPSPSEVPPVPEHSDFPITAELDRDCVVPGGQVTITVVAGENTGVGYHAVYNGGEGGAEPPYGHGHGGNGGDLTDSKGRFQDTWVVSPAAPIGPARVDVVAARDGGFSTTVLDFEVADPTAGGCP